MKKQKLTQTELAELISKMDPEQFNDFAKENNRELHQLVAWSEGVEVQARNSFRIAHEIMDQSVLVDDLTAMVHDNPDRTDLAEQLALETMRLQALFDDIENKVDSFGQVMKLMAKDVEKYQALAEVAETKAKSIKSRIDNFKSRIVVLLNSLDLKKVEGTFFTISLGKPTYSVTVNEFTDEELERLPEKFLRVKKDLDKAAVKTALLEGEVLPWAALTQKTGIVIR